MNSYDISIIIPIYNGELRLRNCLDSIVEQDYESKEIILIDDGSIDKTKDICLEYTKKYKNIKYYYQENKGVSEARNNGIEKAKGKYLYFMDCDDTIPNKEVIKKMIELAKKEEKELYIFHYNIEEQGKIKILPTKLETRNYKKKEFYQNITEETQFGGYLWNKLFLRDIIKSNHISFNQNLKILEDIDFVIQYAKVINTFYYSKETIYLYYQNPSSVLHKKFNKKNLSILEAIDSFIEELESYNIELNYFYYLYFFTYKIGKNLYPEETSKEKERNAKDRYQKLIHSNQSIIQKMKIIMIQYFPKIIIKIKGYKRSSL
ncbi:MAG: glycosyltransferase family 2 protein [Bacilli bacterium]|nr:glycosyltransferase family 2 protein [Bacilli bacterium]